MPINKLNFSVPITDVIRERFMSFVSIQPSGCWLWAGRLDPDYGRFTVHGVTIRCPRAAWLVLRGPIPDGFEPDHLCRLKPCVNPDHMELVTHLENIRRGDAGKHLSDRTHCPQGHPYDEANTYLNPNGSRKCRICRAAMNIRKRRREGRRERLTTHCYRGHPFTEENTILQKKKDRTQRLCRMCRDVGRIKNRSVRNARVRANRARRKQRE